MNVVSNSQTILSIVAGGLTGSLTYQWLFNGNPLANQTNSTLTLSGVQATQLGSYRTILTGSGGAVTSAVINVYFDTDRDALGDDWESNHFGNLAQAGWQDFDNDGVTNLEEFEEGTSPNNPASLSPRLHLAARRGSVVASPLRPRYTLGEQVTLTAVPDVGQSFIGWFGSTNGTANPLTLTMNATKSLQAVFGIPLGEATDAPQVTWITGGDAGWFGQSTTTHDQADAARSGAIGHNQQTWLQAIVTNTAPVQLSFWVLWSTSGSDYWDFFINSTRKMRESSPFNAGQKFFWYLPPGTNVLTWVFAKGVNDTTFGTGVEDAIFLDEVVLEPLPGISLVESELNVVEGNVGQTSISLTVTINPPPVVQTTVNYATLTGSAQAGNDYTAAISSLIFAPGERTKPIPIAVLGDRVIEPNEYLFLRLTGASSGALVRTQAVINILNDDGLPGQVRYFDLSLADPVQTIGQPFLATITARDASGNPAYDFNGTVSLRAVVRPPAAFAEDFEEGVLDGWVPGALSYAARRITNSIAAQGTNSLVLIGGFNNDASRGLRQAVSPTPIPRMDFFVLGTATNQAGGSVYLADSNNIVSFFTLGNLGNLGMFERTNEYLKPYQKSEWNKVSIFYDWTNKTTSFAVNDQMAYLHFPFYTNSVSKVTDIYLFNVQSTEAYWDDITLSGTNAPSHHTIFPTSTGPFSAGLWTGEIGFAGAAGDLELWANDEDGHFGYVPVKLIRQRPQFVAANVVGGNFQFQLQGTTNDLITVQYSTNLETWLDSVDVWLTNGIFTGTSAMPTGEPVRFYRARLHEP
ncbi:MAG: hypothetical protein JNN07_26940 [Verrucomicrobiales bacterium]|nr:hypothetical protein [Verrucomicrobiales bacterium]